MCEPHHSIIQYPDDNGHSSSLLSQLGKFIKGFWNISKMGKGHSEALQRLEATYRANGELCLSHGERVDLILPDKLDFEVGWWNRSIRFDVRSCAQHLYELKHGDALDSATDYANLTSIGSIKTLRQFLQRTIMFTDRPHIYAYIFHQILNEKGRVQYDKHINSFEDRRAYRGKGDKRKRESLVKWLCGFTRKRNLLVPEWADDSGVWVPSS